MDYRVLWWISPEMGGWMYFSLIFVSITLRRGEIWKLNLNFFSVEIYSEGSLRTLVHFHYAHHPFFGAWVRPSLVIHFIPFIFLVHSALMVQKCFGISEFRDAKKGGISIWNFSDGSMGRLLPLLAAAAVLVALSFLRPGPGCEGNNGAKKTRKMCGFTKTCTFCFSFSMLKELVFIPSNMLIFWVYKTIWISHHIDNP